MKLLSIAGLMLVLFLASCGDETLIEYYPSGEVQAEYEFSNKEEQTGLKKSYYETGELEEEYSFEKGEKNGLFKWYHSNGNIKMKANYVAGKLEGVLKEYYENGDKKSEAEMKDGVQHGISKFWYESGKLQSESEYEKGILVGDFREYYKTGELSMEAIMDNDSNVYFQSFEKDGTIKEEFRFLELKQEKNELKLGEDLTISVNLYGPELKYDHEVVLTVDAMYDKEPFVENMENVTLNLDENKELTYTIKSPNKTGDYLFVVSVRYKDHLPRTKADFRAEGSFTVIEGEIQ